jgi:hypothetical protein
MTPKVDRCKPGRGVGLAWLGLVATGAFGTSCAHRAALSVYADFEKSPFARSTVTDGQESQVTRIRLAKGGELALAIFAGVPDPLNEDPFDIDGSSGRSTSAVSRGRKTFRGTVPVPTQRGLQLGIYYEDLEPDQAAEADRIIRSIRWRTLAAR